jgi:putative phage-type endonuclease
MIYGCDQRTAEWFAARLGKATASRISDILATTKSGPAASRKNYAAQLVCERLTGEPQETYSNAAMQWGTDQEPFARDAYCEHMLCKVVQVGFVDHPTIPMAGCSPDGLVGDEGMTEFKCPNTSTHIETLLGGGFADKYVKQAHWQLACYPERKWNDLVSFDPRLPENMRLFIQRIPRDDEAIAALESEVAKFLREVDETVDLLRARYEREKEAA